MRIDDHAIADDSLLAGTHNARRQKRELVGNAVDDERMAGIVSALEANHDVRTFGEPVDNLALALVTPLRTNHHDIRHHIILYIAQRLRPTQTRASILCCFWEIDPS